MAQPRRRRSALPPVLPCAYCGTPAELGTVIDFASPARVMCAECTELSRPVAVYVGDAPPVDPGYSWCPPSPLAVEPISPAADWECPGWLPWVMLVGVCLLVGALIVVEGGERKAAGAKYGVRR